MTNYISKCATFSQVKSENQVPYRNTQSFQVPTGKWDDIAIDFVAGFVMDVNSPLESYVGFIQHVEQDL